MAEELNASVSASGHLSSSPSVRRPRTILGPKQENVGHSASEEAEATAAAKRQESIRLLPYVVSKATYHNYTLYVCFSRRGPVIVAKTTPRTAHDNPLLYMNRYSREQIVRLD